MHLYSFEGEATVFQVNEQGIQHSENKTQKLTEKLLAIYSREVEADADEDEVDNVLASFDFEPQIFGASSSFNGLYTAVYFKQVQLCEGLQKLTILTCLYPIACVRSRISFIVLKISMFRGCQ